MQLPLLLVAIFLTLAVGLTLVAVFTKVSSMAGSKSRLRINICSCLSIASVCLATAIYIYLGQDGRITIYSEFPTKVISASAICYTLVALSVLEAVVGLIHRAQKRHNQRGVKPVRRPAEPEDAYD